MQMSGEQRIAAPRREVWQALNDPDVLRQCIPGCQSLERDGENRFAAVAEVKIGPIGARFKGAVELSELDAPNGYAITGQGSGGIAGSAKGVARVRLRDDGAGTVVSYDVDAEVGGRMAQLGGPIIDATARQMAGRFFAKFGEVVGAAAAVAMPAEPVAVSVAGAGAGPATAPVPAMPPAPTGGFPTGWVLATVAAIIAGFLLGRSDAADWWVIATVVLAVVAAAAGYDSGRKARGRP